MNHAERKQKFWEKQFSWRFQLALAQQLVAPLVESQLQQELRQFEPVL